MEPSPPNFETPAPSPIPEPPAMSPAARLFNIFPNPGEVFETIKAARVSAANWVVPTILFALAGSIAMSIAFHNPVFIQQMHEQQAAAINQQVEAGKIPQAKADERIEQMEKYTTPSMMSVFGSLFFIIYAFARLFGLAFVLWLLARLALKVQVPYLKVAEVVGFATMIMVLAIIVGSLLTQITGRMFASPSPAFFLEHFDIKNRTHQMLGALNIFYLWSVSLLALGLSRVGRIPFGRTLAFVLGYWMIQELLLIAMGLGQMAL